MPKFLWIAAILLLKISFGQKSIIEYYQYSIKDGLVNNWVNDFEKDQNGFIWIATNDGISRFDGYNFINFSSENQSLIPNNSSFQDVQIHGNEVYAISNEKGIFVINISNLKVKRIVSKGVSSYFRNDDLSLIYYTNGFLVLKNQDRIVAKRQFGKSGFLGRVIFSEGKIILNNSFTSVFLLNEKLNIISHVSLNLEANGLSIINHKKLGTLFCSSKGFFKLQGNSFLSVGKQSDLNKFSFYNYTEDGKPFYILNFKTPVMPYYKGNYVFSLDKNQNTEVRTIFHLGNDSWLIGTNQGVYKLNIGKRFSSQIQDNLFDDDVIRVRRKIIDYQNKLYLLGFPGIVEYDLKLDSQKFITESQPRLTNYDAVLVDNNIIATSEGKGVWKFDLNTKTIAKIKSNYIGEFAFFNCIQNLGNNQLIFGGKGELVIYDYQKNKSSRLCFSDQIAVYDIEFLDNSKEILLGTNKGLFSFYFEPGKFYNKSVTINLIKRTKLKGDLKNILVNSDKKSIFIASDNGLYQLGADLKRLENHYLKPDEISNQKVTGLLEDSKGRIWASTYSGITCFDVRLNKHYFISDKHGLVNSEFNYKSFERLSDGRLIFGGLYGYDIIDPKLFNFNISNSKIILAGFKTEKEGEGKPSKISQSSLIEFNTGDEDLLLYFKTTDFNNAEMYAIEYKINEGEWLLLTNNNVLRLSNLKGGKNKLKIRLRDSFSNICDEKELEIWAKIPFYYELYFYVLISLIITSLSFLAIYYFKRMKNVEIETKKRISMDLHDETGTILTRVLLMSKSESAIVKNLDVFQSSLKEALFSLRTFMDSLSGKKSYLSDLIIELKEFMSISFRGTNISAQLSSEKIENIWLSAELYRDIKLCMYEAIQNTLKHSDSSKFDVRIYQKKSCLFFEISDNGETNFSLEELEEKGNGFRNFQKRTKRHNGSVKIELKAEKKSVHLFFEFPLK
jgi:signal transduction histidine kinase